MKLLLTLISLLSLAILPLNAYHMVEPFQNSDTLVAATPVYQEITIITPTTEIYDDGVNKTAYTGYDVFDMNDQLVLKVAPSINIPVKLKMAAGTYIIKPRAKELSPVQISVGNRHPVKYVIQQEAGKN